MDIPTASAFISGLTAVKDLGIALLHERDAQKLAALKLEFTERLLDTQTRAQELLHVVTEQHLRIAILEETVRDLNAKKLEHERYHLAQLAPGRGFAYRLKPAAELIERSSEPDHFLCQPCFDQGLKAVLVEGEIYGGRVWDCPLCKSRLEGGAAG